MSPRENYCLVHTIWELPLVSIYRLFGKRLFDLAVCLPVFVVALPAMLLTAILIRLDSRGPVFFLQERLGRFGSTFCTYKFRTMTHRDRTAAAEVLPGHSEVTRVGQWLRRFKIDELPQLLNILRGDMSLVGPRPALPQHIHDYDENGLRRLLERPGLSGLAQVNGNIYLSWPERWAWDAEYVDSLSARRDAGILLRSIAVVLLGEERFLNRPEALDTGAVPGLERQDPSAETHRAA